ncbi:hypothetical protein CVT26_009316 [Gymnopilus dilepis]|uniref:Uncharacterized protein n=1 Tax=Gymnopilus dilepis TaxID=231916 RepID=A0A409YA44_9AGAR|nr:hypothetical protein CVT26_009316 [Gymnopilus dilepis]
MLSADWIIYTVPSDVWRHLFGIFYRGSTFYSSAVDIIRLSHVCSSWRNIIIRAPELWTDIGLEIRSKDESDRTFPNAELLSLILSRSGRMPLTMTLQPWHSQFPSPHQHLILDPVESFLKAANRAKRLTINIRVLHVFSRLAPSKCQELVLEMQPAQLLEELTIELGYEPPIDDCDRLVSRLWAGASLLRSLSFLGPIIIYSDEIEWLKTTKFPFHQLTTLEMETDVPCLFSLLPLTPRLVTAAFEFPDRHGFKIEDAKILRLDVLRDLKLHATVDDGEPHSDSEDEDDRDLGEPMMRLLEFLISPELTTLYMCFWGHRWSLDAFQKFVNRSPQPRIEHLRLDALGGSQEDRLKCLWMLPSLKTLQLAILQDIERVDEDDCISEAFWDALREWDEDAGAFVLCPRVEKITFGYNALSWSASVAFAQMIESRWQRSLEGKKFEVVITDTSEYMNRFRSGGAFPDLDPLLKLKDAGFSLLIRV